MSFLVRTEIGTELGAEGPVSRAGGGGTLQDIVDRLQIFKTFH